MEVISRAIEYAIGQFGFDREYRLTFETGENGWPAMDKPRIAVFEDGVKIAETQGK